MDRRWLNTREYFGQRGQGRVERRARSEYGLFPKPKPKIAAAAAQAEIKQSILDRAAHGEFAAISHIRCGTGTLQVESRRLGREPSAKMHHLAVEWVR